MVHHCLGSSYHHAPGEIQAESLPKEDLIRLAEKIDRLIESSLEHHLLTPVVSDSAYLRRVTLDLAGRIPSVSELRRYETLDAKDKKHVVTKQLIESPDFAYHQETNSTLYFFEH